MMALMDKSIALEVVTSDTIIHVKVHAHCMTKIFAMMLTLKTFILEVGTGRTIVM